MALGEGIRRTERLVAVDSLDRNMTAEDEAFGRVMNRKKTAGTPAEDDDMRIIAGGNVIINPEPKPVAATATATTGASEKPTTDTTPTKPTNPAKPDAGTSTTTSAVTTAKKKTRWWPAALVATSLLGGAGAGYVAGDLLHPAKDTDTDTITVLDFPTQGN